MAVPLRDWGVCVGLNPDGELLSGILVPDASGAWTECGDPRPVELVCEHFLTDVNDALGTHFQPEDFPMVSCEGHGPWTRAKDQGRGAGRVVLKDICPQCGAPLEWANLGMRCPKGCGVFG